HLGGNLVQENAAQRSKIGHGAAPHHPYQLERRHAAVAAVAADRSQKLAFVADRVARDAPLGVAEESEGRKDRSGADSRDHVEFGEPLARARAAPAVEEPGSERAVKAAPGKREQPERLAAASRRPG